MSGIKKRQWVVDHDGIEGCPDTGRYFIPIDGVSDERFGGNFYDLPLHMAEKVWVDLPEFLSAWKKALRINAAQTGQPINDEMVTASCREAFRIWEQERAFMEISRRRSKPGAYGINILGAPDMRLLIGECLRIYRQEKREDLYFDASMF